MDTITAWLKVSGTTLNVGGDPAKGQPPVITAKLEKPQIVIDAKTNTITILETK